MIFYGVALSLPINLKVVGKKAARVSASLTS